MSVPDESTEVDMDIDDSDEGETTTQWNSVVPGQEEQDVPTNQDNTDGNMS